MDRNKLFELNIRVAAHDVKVFVGLLVSPGQ